MKTKEERKARLQLNMLFTVISFCVLFITVIIAGVAVYFMSSRGILIEVPQQPSYLIRPLFVMLLISIVVGIILSWFASRIPLKPLEMAINKINQLASGDFKVRLQYGAPFNTHPDFKELSSSFNKLAEELDSTEMLRSDFINNFSHEFKTPIVSISGFAKLLKYGNLTPEQQEEYLDIIEKESMRLSDMATNVLNMTRVENQAILTDISTYNLSEQIRSCILLLESKWEAKHLEIEADFGEYEITGNRELLNQVWLNLIDNSIKFSPEWGTIEFDIQEAEGKLVVSVMNTGETIPPEKQQRIFQKFYQADESHAMEGNGIGLAIVKKITELHGGKVSVQSENDITIFTIELPAEQ